MMDEKRFKEIEKVVGGLSFADIQDFNQFWEQLENHRISHDDLRDYISEILKDSEEPESLDIDIQNPEVWPRCPNHPAWPVSVHPVPDQDNEQGWKNRWFCEININADDPDQYCDFEILDRRSLNDIIMQYKRTGKVTLPEG